MNKYTKPTISLLTLNAATVAASSCSSSTTDAKFVEGILKDMGYTADNAFGMTESCEEQFPIEGYCKFSSSIQVFYS